MQTQAISARFRTGTGKGTARKLRADGRIPVVVYGGGDPVALDLDPRELTTLRKQTLGWNTPVSINVDGGDDISLALLKDVQRHPVSGNVIHADFLRVDADSPVVVNVPVRTTGKAIGETVGGRVFFLLRAVPVRCKPADIPNGVSIDVTPLDIDDKVMIDEVPMPDGVEVVFKERVPVVKILGKRGRRATAAAAT